MATQDNQQLLQRLLGIFRVEATEHLQAMSSLVQTLEQPAPAAEMPGLIEALFREAHSLKGAARSVSLSEIEVACKALEDILAVLKRNPPTSLAPTWFTSMYARLDELEALLAADGTATPSAAVHHPPPPAAPPVPAAPAPEMVVPLERPLPPTLANSETVRISTTRLAALLVEAEELLAFKFGSGHLAGQLRALGDEVAQWRKAWDRSARDARVLRRIQEKQGQVVADPRASATIAKLLDGFERDGLTLKSVGDRLAGLRRLAEQERRTLASSVDSLQTDIRAALMLPFSSLLELFPKLVRDLSRDSGKAVELHVIGAEIEIDRRILEQMKDPLIHLVRNAIDHGIESNTERTRSGKPLPGRITIGIVPKEGNQIELLVADDGAGVDLGKIRAAASKLGLLAAQDAASLDAQATLDLVFKSGLTTSPIITNLSGRGLGLAIVREKVEKLGGSVSAALPTVGGTQFRIVLPTTLATFRGLLVSLGERQFVLPTGSVERVLRVPANAVKTVENRSAITVDGQAVAMVHLADALTLPAAAQAEEAHLQVAVLEGGGRRIAFAVDAILGDQEVLVKGLGPQLRRVPNIAGATLLGPGRLVPILSVPDLLKSALRATHLPTVAPAAAPARQQSLLVVEDSITARTLLKNILESAGFRVDTAVDGADALAILRTGQFDLVVSDVEMPRMDGFELTARIRGDKKLSGLPVVLVTALESREDKEHGVEVGANAYIVKSSFEQSNLFEVIRRLI